MIGIAVVLAVVLAVIAEVVARLAGLADVPVYEADATIGYQPRADQAGLYRGRYPWAFNAWSMAGPAFAARADDDMRDVLLIGDSVVFGALDSPPAHRLGPQLAAALGARVWPIAAGSWALQNELAWLKRHLEVLRAVDDLVFVLNAADLGPPAAWSCTWTHPRERPWSALWFVLSAEVIKRGCEGTPAELVVPPTDAVADLRALLATLDRRLRVTVFLYPDRREMAAVRGEPATGRSALVSQASGDAPTMVGVASLRAPLQAAGVTRVVPIGDDAGWRGQPDFYRDHIHPTDTANAVLAQIMARVLGELTEAAQNQGPSREGAASGPSRQGR